ncbi:hypothetical protein GNY06_01955 [Elizabethkingia argentiflava]|uniref:Uncharacterized protein n=1 Tax=Elizabethkingia argenteiflava TaxID=2681556 RepID=A0A845PVR3_9FLAO|nr:hypothetical protein [Elizabethkingia argenteiflava]NAW50200.1 hypothetical protein [Elizabethkingia argenteiflava]
MRDLNISHLLSKHKLSNDILGFLERIKFHAYHLENQQRFELISNVNQSPELLNQIFKSQYETGFAKKIDLKLSPTKTPKHEQLQKINLARKSIYILRKTFRFPTTILFYYWRGNL